MLIYGAQAPRSLSKQPITREPSGGVALYFVVGTSKVRSITCSAPFPRATSRRLRSAGYRWDQRQASAPKMSPSLRTSNTPEAAHVSPQCKNIRRFCHPFSITELAGRPSRAPACSWFPLLHVCRASLETAPCPDTCCAYFVRLPTSTFATSSTRLARTPQTAHRAHLAGGRLLLLLLSLCSRSCSCHRWRLSYPWVLDQRLQLQPVKLPHLLTRRRAPYLPILQLGQPQVCTAVDFYRKQRFPPLRGAGPTIYVYPSW